MKRSGTTYWTAALLVVLGLVLSWGTCFSAAELVVGIATDPVSVDPRVVPGVPGRAMLRHVYEPLVWHDRSGKILPVLAESWRRVDDTTWRLQLRKGVVFHNGEPFDATSVKFTLDSIFDKNNRFVNSQLRGYVGQISKVTVVDAHTIDIVTKQPSRAILANLTTIYMVPAQLAGKLADRFATQPTGTGPFRLVSYAASSRLVLEAFDKYWGKKPNLSKLTFRILPENATRLAALESGEVSLIDSVPPDAVERISKNPNLTILSEPSSRVIFIGLEVDRQPFNNPKVRLALTHAINRDLIVKQMLGGRADIATGPMSPNLPGFNKDLPQYKYDPEKAKQLLAEAGFPRGAKVKFGFSSGRYLMDKQIGEVLVAQLAMVGIEAEYEAMEWGSFFAGRRDGKYDAWLYGMGAMTPDPDFALQWFGRTPLTKYKNPKVEQLLADADRAREDKRSEELYRAAQEIIWQDNPWIFLYYQPELYGASKKLTGFKPRPDEFFLLFDASLTR